MVQKARNSLQKAISLLLVVCLLSLIAAYEPAAWHHSEKHPKSDLLAPTLMARALGIAIPNQRSNPEPFDSIFKDALILEQASIGLTRASFSFPTEFGDRTAQCAGQSTITIRAPPCFKA